MPHIEAATVEMEALYAAIVLGLVQVTLAAFAAMAERGLGWGLGSRDAATPPLGKFAARLERAWWNFLETFAFFAAAVLMADALGRHTAWSALGAQMYFWARVAYVPVYAAGIPVLRTLIWLAALLGLVMVLMAVWPG